MTPLQRRTRRWLLLLAALGSVGCHDALSPRDIKAPPSPSSEINDGAHGAGNQDVWFLPPMVANPVGQPGYGDPFDAGLQSEISIVIACKSPATSPYPASACQGTVFPQGSVKMSATDQQYMVNWDTKSPGVDPGDTFTIEVHVGSKKIAWADVFIVGNGSAKNVATSDDIVLPDGRTLPIKVRIEQGWNCDNNTSCVSQVVSASATTPTLVKTNDGRAAALFPPGTLPTGVDQVLVTIEDVTSNLTSTETCKNPTGPLLTNMVVSPQCFKFTTDPKITFQQPVTVETCVDVVPVRSAGDPLYQTEQLIKYDVGEQTTFLRNVDALFSCPVDNPGTIGSRSSNSLMNYALAALADAGRAAVKFFTPKPAYALHLGMGGLIDDGGGFSYITAGFPITETYSSGAGQTGVVATPLAQPFKVLITSQHNNLVPVPNEPVRCDVTAGGGTFAGATTATVLTGADGIAACPILTLGTTAGTNTVTATALNIDDGVVAIEDLGEGPVPVTLHGVVTFNATATASTLGFVNVTRTDGQTPFDNSTLTIDGPLVNYIATIQNPGSALGNSDVPVVLQNWVQQGNTRRAAGGTVLTCSSQGVLPNGTCVQNWGASADDIQGAGSGAFTPGSATLVLELWQGSVGGGTLLATKSIPITLVQGVGTIQGTVRDPSGAAIPGATVSALLGDGTPHQAQTNADGVYQISQLTPGIYNVSLVVTGYNSPNQQGIVVRAGATTTVNFSPSVVIQ